MSLLSRIAQGIALGLLVSLAINFASKNGHLKEKSIVPDAKTCDKVNAKAGKITDFEEFYKFFLCEHSKPSTKLFHFLGLFASFYVMTTSFFRPTAIFAGFVQAAVLAVLSHKCLEFNESTWIDNPAWQAMCDYRMFQDIFRGRVPVW